MEDWDWFDDASSPQAIFQRWLEEKKKSKDPELDYSVLAVVVITLGLILIVELVRHKIDHAAEHRQLFSQVLHGVYSELATLGIVEAGVHVVLSYVPDLDGKGKKVFADVHFLLFFVAVFNALSTCILAYFSSNVSDRLWVQAEELELHHYVAIREEFERIEQKLEKLNPYSTMSTRESPHLETAYDIDASSLKKMWRSFIENLRAPVLKSRHRQLLLQVRFHELRLHFLRGNELPLKLKVSDYLKRSEVDVHSHLVHISALSWLLLTGAVNLLYYLLGIVSYVTDDLNAAVAQIASHFYVWGNVGVVCICLLLFNKMKKIFAKVMNMQFQTDDHKVEITEGARVQQQELFWWGNPEYIVGIVQFMQFSYAMAAAILLIYWTEIKNDGVFPTYSYPLATGVCYILFVGIMSHTLPRYTMCTSLGNLLDETRLAETVAHHRLEEARRVGGDDPDTVLSTRKRGGDDSTSVSTDYDKLGQLAEMIQSDTASLRGLLPEDQRMAKMKARRSKRKKSSSDSRLVAEMRSSMSRVSSTPPASRAIDTVIEDSTTLASRTSSDLTGSRQRAGRNRYRSTSAGVAQMRGSTSVESLVSLGESQPLHVFDLSGVKQDDQNQTRDQGVEVFKDEGQSSRNDFTDNETTKTPGVQKEEEVDLLRTIQRRYEEYALSMRYRMVSGVFGTMICFFLLAMRVENILLATDQLKDLGGTFHLPKEVNFWMVVAWFAIMICESSWRFWYFMHTHAEVRYASLVDFTLCYFCIAMFLFAEVLRCCEDEAPDCCPRFGTRTYGGLGNFEPFASLIVLRLFRFYIGRKIAKKLGQYKKRKKPKSDGHNHHAVGSGPMEFEHGTIVQLWEKAIHLFPEIVKEKGEFSGELFHAMLGVKRDKAVPEDVIHANVDEETQRAEESKIPFVDTDARLVRSMRRADLLLLPIMNEWHSVDVVMTKFELVFIEVTDIDRESPEELRSACRALGATKGGKGLRLSDVLLGRKVLAHLDLTTVDEIHVERFPASETGNNNVSCSTDFDVKSEFWFYNDDTAKSPQDRHMEWRHVNEYHLKLHSSEGTFFARFYSDLDNAVFKMQLNEPEEQAKIQALLWAKGIGRVCGTRQLKQYLPHYGEEGEMEDYIELKHRGREEDHTKTKIIPDFKYVRQKSIHRLHTLSRSISGAEFRRTMSPSDAHGERGDTSDDAASESKQGKTDNEADEAV